MKKIIGMYISILLLGTLYAQEKQNPDSTFINSLKPGSWSVQFGISSNFTLTNFNGSSIYFKRHITVHKAWRFGVLFNGRLEDFERDVQGNNAPSYGITT